MPKIRKRYSVTISKKFPDGSIGSIAYGTDREDTVEKATADAEEKIFRLAYESTLADIKKTSKIDPLVASIWGEIKQQLTNERLVENAERNTRKEKNKLHR